MIEMSPYWGKNFFSFFFVLFHRIIDGVRGKLFFQELFSDELQVIVLSLTAISCALVGSLLILKRMVFLANALSHTILLGIVITFLLFSASFSTGFSWNLLLFIFASFLSAIVTTFLTEALSRGFRLQKDASIGLVFTSLFALGVLLINLYSRNVHLGTETVMGNVDTLQIEDLKIVGYLLIFNLLSLFLFFKEFALTIFDPLLGRALGLWSRFFHYLLMVQLSATVVGAFRSVGVLLVLSFLVAPYLTARFFFADLKKLLFFSSFVGILASLCGVATSRHVLSVYGIALSTGGLVVCYLTGFFVVGAVFHLWKKKPRAVKESNEVREMKI